MNYKKFLLDIKKDINDAMDTSRDYSDKEIMELIENCVLTKARMEGIGLQKKREIANAVFNSMRKLDILQPFIDDPTISEIMVNGTDSIFVERNGAVIKEEICFENREKLYNIIQAIVSKVNRSVNESSPIVDARLDDGSRVNAVLPPVAINGPILTIRKFPDKPFTIPDLIKMSSITEDAAKLLENAVKAKYNIFISGGTGSGKTTFLNALSEYIPASERVITIEDSAELQILGITNLVRLETRNVNVEGKGEVTIRDLIKASLRMRPDRIIVGEVRGPEALDMLQAMNTGHDGSLSTGHANSTGDMLSRLETMVLCGTILPLDAIRRQIASAIDLIVHLGRTRDFSRKVLEISEITGYENGNFQLNTIYKYDDGGGSHVKVSKGLINIEKLQSSGLLN